jgi:hypothetical protein
VTKALDPIVESVKYAWPEWYTRLTYASGRVVHWGPWMTKWAADKCGDILKRRNML